MLRRGNTKPIEMRFVGRGPWQATCSRCPATKVIKSNHTSTLPPRAIIKKMHQAGWFVGNKAKDDLCPECYRKPIASAATTAKKALAHMAAPMVTNGAGHAVHYSEVEASALKLPHEQIRQLIKALREALPAAPPKAQKAPVVIENDDEYARWLEGLK